MNGSLIFLVIAFASIGIALGDVNQVKLRIGEEITWKQFFDAGFRPHHVMDGKSFCRQFDVQLSISSGNSAQWLEMSRGTAFFDIAEDDLVLGFRFDTTDNLSVEQAKERLARFQQIFGDKIKPGYEGVIEYKETENRYDYDKSSSRADLQNWRIRYSLTASYQEVQYPQPPREQWTPFIERLSIVYRGEKLNHIPTRDKPIEPPAGYENVSLAAPPAATVGTQGDKAAEASSVSRLKHPRHDHQELAKEKRLDKWYGPSVGLIILMGIVIWMMLRQRGRRSS